MLTSFISKIEGALQELDETGYWLELLRDAGINRSEGVGRLVLEADELMAIFVTMVRGVKSRSCSPA